MYNFCTLFDSAYIDRGLIMYYSILEKMQQFMLYIYAFDRKTFEILSGMNLDKVKVIFIETLETEKMLSLKASRTRAEYCWTFTPIIIEYSLDKFLLDNCTYIDADIYFYADPTVLLKELEKTKSSIMIVKHGFPNTFEYKRLEKRSGIYCVQFNTFLNNAEGRRTLTWWKEKCLDCCSSTGEKGNFGDQKYLDNWKKEFRGVHVLEHLGAGVAPWNVSRYQLRSTAKEMIIMEKNSKTEMPLIFYHFHALRDLDEKHMNIRVYCRQGKVDNLLIETLYKGYIERLQEIRCFLQQNYGFQYPFNSKMQDNQEVLKVTKKKTATWLVEKYYEVKTECRIRIRGKRDIWNIKNGVIDKNEKRRENI